MKIKITIIIILILILAVGGFFIIMNKNGGGVTDEPETSRGIFSGFFPFGNSSPINDDEDRGPSPDTSTQGSGSLQSVVSEGLKLQQLTNVPVAGFTASTSPEGEFVRYMEREMGNIFDINTSTLGSKRVTNTLIPLSSEIVWSENADTFFVRHVDKNDVIKTYSGAITESGTSTTDEFKSISGNYIEDGLTQLVVNAERNEVLYLDSEGVGSAGFITTFDDEEEEVRKIFSSPFAEWILEWPNDETLTATTKASYFAPGYMYLVDKETGVFTKVLGGIEGLTTSISNSGEYVLYSGYINDVFETYIANLEDKSIAKNRLVTLPEKCAWSNLKPHISYCGAPELTLGTGFPDRWYKGEESFSDNIWMINAKTNQITKIASPRNLSEISLDVIDPIISENEALLIFKNKKDSTLWSLELPNIIEELYVDDEEIEDVEEELPAS